MRSLINFNYWTAMKIQLFLLFLFTNIIFSQKLTEELVPVVTEGSDKVYINAVGVENQTASKTKTTMATSLSTPITIESIENKISKTKTYYLLNQKLVKYSILFIIYYDDSNNVLASYDYKRNTNVEAYQYNYPIWDNSVEHAILNKCVNIIEAKKSRSSTENK